MNLTIPGVGTENSPQWATDINASLSAIDSHNHSSGEGVQITPNGLNINADLAFQDNNATTLRSARFTPQLSVLTGALDVGCLYVVNNELYYNDVTGGHNVQLTLNGVVNATSSGISSGTATAAFAAGVLVVKSSSSSGADILMQSVVLTNSGNLTNQLTLQAPTLSGSITETLPSIPASQSFMTIDASGNMAAYAPVANGITGSNVVSNINLPGTSVQAGGQNVIVSNTNATKGLAIVRATFNGSGALLFGEGATAVHNSTGVYTVTFSTAFADGAVVTTNAYNGTATMVTVVSQSSTGCLINALIANTLQQQDISFSIIAIGQV